MGYTRQYRGRMGSISRTVSHYAHTTSSEWAVFRLRLLVLLQLLIPVITWSLVNVTADINDFRFISLDTSRVSREEVCLPSFNVVNCLLKICVGEDTWESSKVMISISAFGGDFPSIVLIVLHSLEWSVLLFSVSTNCLHVILPCSFVVLVISSSICCRAGEVGSLDLRSSCALILSNISAGTL